jgi:hypothetical protein
MITFASYLLYGIQALPVAVEVSPAEPGLQAIRVTSVALREAVRRAEQALVSSGFRPLGTFRIALREAGQVGQARSSRIKVAQCRLAPA